MARDCTRGPIGIDSIGDQVGLYGGIYDGGYYGGSNERFNWHTKWLHDAAEQVQRLDPAGAPSPSGIIGLVGFGFSDARMTWDDVAAQLLTRTPAPRAGIVPVNCAHAGYDAADWSNPAHAGWTTHAPAELAAAGVTAQQVQVAWIMTGIQTVTQPFPAHVTALQAQVEQIARNALAAWPNLRILYLDTVPGQHYQATPPAQEPTYFEQGFAVRLAIEQQVYGSTQLNCDPSLGPVVAPVLDWGGQLWCDGARADSRGRTWLCSDVMADGHHPSPLGQAKLATWLLDRWYGDATAVRWLVGAPEIGGAGTSGGATQEAGT